MRTFTVQTLENGMRPLPHCARPFVILPNSESGDSSVSKDELQSHSEREIVRVLHECGFVGSIRTHIDRYSAFFYRRQSDGCEVVIFFYNREGLIRVLIDSVDTDPCLLRGLYRGIMDLRAPGDGRIGGKIDSQKHFDVLCQCIESLRIKKETHTSCGFGGANIVVRIGIYQGLRLTIEGG